MAEAVAGHRRIKLQSSYAIYTWTSMQIVQRMQQHGTLMLTALLAGDHPERFVQQDDREHYVEVQELDENQNKVRTLFHGYVTNIRVKTVRGIYYVELEAVSHTARLDVKRSIRSFQDSAMNYSELTERVLSDYPGSDFIDEATGSSKLNGLVLQYMETDWQLLQRIASRFQAMLVADSTATTPKFWIGVPEGRLHTLGDVPYEVKRSFSQGQTDASTGGWDGESRLSYTVESDQYYRIGDKVRFQKKELTVVESTAELRDSEWIYHYKLYQESDLKSILITNSSVIGAALEGRILDVKGDKVRIHLNVDAEQGKEQACWLPYKSAYTAEGNSGFYCMPQTGDSVQLYMPSASEKEAVVISSVRKGGGSPKLADPSVKYWGTSFGKELKLGGSELVLNGQENQLFIKLDTGEGITIESPKSLRLTSDKTMELAAEKRVELRAGETMYLLSGASSLVLDGETDIQGTSLKVEGLQKLPVFVEDLEPEPEVPFADEVQEQSAPEAQEEQSAPAEEAPPKKKKKGLFGKIMDGVQLALDVAGMIPVIGVAANVVNAGISVGRGDYVGAALSMAACIPFAGAVIKGAKLAKAGMKAFKLTQNIMKTSKSVVSAVKTAATQQKILGDVITAARKLGSNLTLQAKLKKLQLGMKIALVGSLPVRRYNLENDPLGWGTMKSYFSGISSRVVDTLMSPIEIIKMGIGLHATAWKTDDPLKSYWEQISGFYGNLVPSMVTAFKSYMSELSSGDPNAWGRATFDLLTLPIAWGKAATVASKTSTVMVSSIKNSTSKISKYLDESLPQQQWATSSGHKFSTSDMGSTPNKPHVNTPEQQKKIDMLMGRDPEGTGKPKDKDKNKKEREREEEERRRREEETEGTGKDLLSPNGKFIDSKLESDYQKYLARKAKEGKPSRDRLEWKKARDYWLNDSPMARGNAFNKKSVVEEWYPCNEVHLSNGKRLDSYDPIKGEIVSRKATDLADIELSTFESYLKEMKVKYEPGTIIRTDKYADFIPPIDGQPLKGKQILEIPASNKNFSGIQDYIDLAKNKYGIEIRFREE